jgi:predicted XRE-type DNA-binding protein
MNKINKVKIKTGTRKQIAETFKVSVTTVSLAVNGVTKSYLADKIKIYAVALGGDPIYKEI